MLFSSSFIFLLILPSSQNPLFFRNLWDVSCTGIFIKLLFSCWCSWCAIRLKRHYLNFKNLSLYCIIHWNCKFFFLCTDNLMASSFCLVSGNLLVSTSAKNFYPRSATIYCTKIKNKSIKSSPLHSLMFYLHDKCKYFRGLGFLSKLPNITFLSVILADFKLPVNKHNYLIIPSSKRNLSINYLLLLFLFLNTFRNEKRHKCLRYLRHSLDCKIKLTKIELLN